MKFRRWAWGVVLVAMVGNVAAAVAANDPRLEAELAPLIARHQGEVAIVVKQLDGEIEFRHAADRPMPTASLIKIPVMIETYRQAEAGTIRLEEMLELRDEDKVPGSGILTPHFSPGVRLSLRDAVRLMIAHSDNTATNLVLDRIGLRSTSETMERWNLPHTKLHAKVFRRDTSIAPERSREFGLGSTTAAEMVSLLEQLDRGTLVSPPACQQMWEHLLACEDRNKLARFLPSGARLAHKSGAVGNVRCDAGILELPTAKVAVCVLTNRNEDRTWGANNAAEIFCGRVGEIVASRFAAAGDSAEPFSLRPGAAGERVEELQRTLNARLDPSPELSVDGDYGSLTEAAVRRFQRDRDLSETGIADLPTLQALAPLVSASEAELSDDPLPPRKPSDPLDGPPFVTCRGWILMDGRTGEVVSGHQDYEPVPMASTTKMMTAYLALQAIQRDPELADSVVTFSERANRTRGSTSGLRAGERIPLRELLYGLLLPSGNDASVAIAEHLGERFPPASDQEEDREPLARFIHQMNVEAQELGMEQTRYMNTHGLDSEGHHASPRDLARLARRALDFDLFQEIVSTRRYRCVVHDEAGTSRTVLWKNTNQLLQIEGYDGVKTGTTGKAGACLVSSARRGEQWLFCVVLGSQGTASRYTDTRNLFRWGFQQASKPSPERN
jgi:serine-type D-Ala-D-Ala carboxypeptidase (penicillin-binding protein 5/6)